MKTLVITSKSVRELKVLQFLAEKMGMKVKVLTEEDKEDIGLLKAMLQGRKEEYVEEEEVFKILREK